jgi:hypothetical protein
MPAAVFDVIIHLHNSAHLFVFHSTSIKKGRVRPNQHHGRLSPTLHSLRQAIRRTNMKRRIWYIIPVFLNGFSITIDAFSQKKSNGKIIIRNLDGQISEQSKEHCHIRERRNFLETSLGLIASIGTLVSNPSHAEAADLAFGKNGPGKKLGGLANKIRNICKNMVCFTLYLLFLNRFWGLNSGCCVFN